MTERGDSKPTRDGDIVDDGADGANAGPPAEDVTALEAPGRLSYVRFVGVHQAIDEQPVLVNCSFDIDPGGALAILGTPGSAKSLITRLIMGFDQPDLGEVWVAGCLLDSFAVREAIRKKVSLVSRSGMVLESLTVAENVRKPLEIRKQLTFDHISQVVLGLLDMGNLQDAANLTPAELPLPQRRVLALLNAMSEQPECLVLEEPTDQQHPLLSSDLTRLISVLKEKLRLTLVIGTNDLDLVGRVADKVLFLNHGRVVFFGTSAEFFSSRDQRVEHYRRMERPY